MPASRTIDAVPYELRASEYRERAAKHRRATAASLVAGRPEAAAFHEAMAHASDVYAEQFDMAAIAHDDARAVA
jgi:hypothetical protein